MEHGSRHKIEERGASSRDALRRAWIAGFQHLLRGQADEVEIEGPQDRCDGLPRIDLAKLAAGDAFADQASQLGVNGPAVPCEDAAGGGSSSAQISGYLFWLRVSVPPWWISSNCTFTKGSGSCEKITRNGMI